MRVDELDVAHVAGSGDGWALVGEGAKGNKCFMGGADGAAPDHRLAGRLGGLLVTRTKSEVPPHLNPLPRGERVRWGCS